MKFHFWGQVTGFALSIVVNVNCPAPTVSLNGRQCILWRELHWLTQSMAGGRGAGLFLVNLNHAPLICPPSFFSCEPLPNFLTLWWNADYFSLGCSFFWAALLGTHSHDWSHRRPGRAEDVRRLNKGTGCGNFLPLRLDADGKSPSRKMIPHQK